jgi:hypothetical protein
LLQEAISTFVTISPTNSNTKEQATKSSIVWMPHPFPNVVRNLAKIENQ